MMFYIIKTSISTSLQGKEQRGLTKFHDGKQASERVNSSLVIKRACQVIIEQQASGSYHNQGII